MNLILLFTSYRKKERDFVQWIFPIILLLSIFLSGCEMNNGIPITRPDLVPICPADPLNYCDIDLDNNLLFVHIKNNSLAGAEKFHVQVIFYHPAEEKKPQVKAVPLIPAGETVTLSFDANLSI